MPTENESKWVLDKTCEPDIAKLSKRCYSMSQGYLVSSKGVSLRVRKSKLVTEDAEEKYYMTFKYTTKERVIEVEKKLDWRDFHDLWAGCMNKLEKHRYEIKDDHKQLWEIDFFSSECR